jgi:hypothetical protein
VTGGRLEEGTGQHRRWLPWLFAGVALVVVASSELVSLTDQGDGFAAGMHPAVAVMPFLLAGSFAFIGGLILRERPGHGLGRLLAWFGFMFALGVLTDNYTHHTPPLPAQEWVLLASGVGYFFSVVPLVTLTPLFFPSGRLTSPRWRLPLAVAGFGLAVTIAGNLVNPTLHERERDPVTNPLGIEVLEPFIGTITGLGMLPVLALAVAGLVDLVRRYRRSTGVLRLQMRWFAIGSTAVFVAVVGLALAYEFVGIELALTVFALGAPVLPICLGVAVLRYRLYDIDRVVSRTVSYGLVTLVLVGVYAGSVVGLGAVVRSASGDGGGDLVVAVSTLLVAAAFGPVRRRVQMLVDRRFNRARYDAAQTVERFAHRLRDEVDIEALRADLVAVVNEAMQPDGVGVWTPPLVGEAPRR